MSQHARVHTDDPRTRARSSWSSAGMTCASCAARIEKKLNRMPGVRASVNYATETAHVVLPEGTTVEDAIGTIEATGYTAALPAPPPTGDRRRWTR